MNKRGKMVPIVLCLGMLLSACGGEDALDMAYDSLPVEIVLEPDYEINSQQKTYNLAADDSVGVFSEVQAFEAVRNYYKTINPDYDNSEDSGDYWDVTRGDNGEIIVTYRSYTGAINRYYVDEVSGNTYVTEQVPGIIDGKSNNDYLANIH